MKLRVAAFFAVVVGAVACVDAGDGQKEAPAPTAVVRDGVELGAWMKTNAVPALSASDGARLRQVFDHLVDVAPPGYPGWVESARAGSERAAAADFDGARGACKRCHDAHKARFRAEHRGLDARR